MHNYLFFNGDSSIMNKQNIPIVSVNVLTDGAIITRKGKIKLSKGLTTITITDLSEYLDEESIKVRGTSHKTTLTDIIPHLEYIYYKDNELKELEKKIKKIKEDIEDKRAELGVIESTIKTLNNTINKVGEGFGQWGIRKNLTAENFDNYLKYYKKTILDEKIKQLSINREIKKLNEKLKVLENELSQTSTSKKRLYEIGLNFESKEEIEFELELNYTVTNASWEPLYMIDIESGKNATIQRFAKIYNKSNVDWDGVSLSISTTNRRPIRIEEVSPLYLYLEELYPEYQERNLLRSMAPPMAMPSPMPSKAKKMALEEAPKEQEKPQLDNLFEESVTNLTTTGHQRFELKGKYDVATRKPKTVLLDTITLELKKEYYWDALQEKLILTHELQNKDQFLMKGNAKVFVDGDFVSQTYLDLIHPNEKFTVGLVETYDIKIKKKLLKREIAKIGLTKGKEQLDFEYKITIKNKKDEEATLKIIDRIPYSSSADIEINVKEIRPKPDKNVQGVLEWKLKLANKEEKIINYSYSVRYPKERKLIPHI